MTAETHKKGPENQDEALLGKIEVLYREADKLSATLKPSTSVKSQDVKRLPIIGSLPLTTGDKHGAAPSQKDSQHHLSTMAKTDMITNIVLTGIVSRPGGESGHDGIITSADKGPDKSFPVTSREDPFIAIKNAVEIAGRSDNSTDNNLTSQPNDEQSASQTTDLAKTLFEIIKQQIDTAIDTRISAFQREGKTQIFNNGDNAVAIEENVDHKRDTEESDLDEIAKKTQETENPTTTSKLAQKPEFIAETSAKNTQTSAKPTWEQTEKKTGAKDD